MLGCRNVGLLRRWVSGSWGDHYKHASVTKFGDILLIGSVIPLDRLG
ncbi:5526_t:CDS:1, partial [Ambispora gerdemannii]